MNVYKEIKRDVVWIIAFVFLLTLVLNFFKVGWDSTDGTGEQTWQRNWTQGRSTF